MPYTPVPHQYRTSSILEPLEGADAVLFEAGQLAEREQESSDENNFHSTPLNDFVEAETTQGFLNEPIALHL